MTSHFDEAAKVFAVMKQASRLEQPWSLREVAFSLASRIALIALVLAMVG